MVLLYPTDSCFKKSFLFVFLFGSVCNSVLEFFTFLMINFYLHCIMSEKILDGCDFYFLDFGHLNYVPACGLSWRMFHVY